MWNREDTVESAALQFASVLYSVPQVSVKIATLSEEHKKMLNYYLSFWRENKEVLLEGKIFAENPESVYSVVRSEKGGKAIVTSYTDRVIDCGANREVIAVNCSRSKELILSGALGKTFKVVNCMGETLSQGIIDCKVFEVKVPMAGMVFVK
jgi:alpha-galactosidase